MAKAVNGMTDGRRLIGPAHAHLDAPCTDACYEADDGQPTEQTKRDASNQTYFMSGYEAGKRDALDPSLADGQPTPAPRPDAVLTLVDASGGRWLVAAYLGPVTRAGADEERDIASFAGSIGLTVVDFKVVLK